MPASMRAQRVLMMHCSNLVQRLQAARRNLRLRQELAQLARFDPLILDDSSCMRRDHSETALSPILTS